MQCFVCGEDAASVPVDGGWNRVIHEECKHVYPLAQEYVERYQYASDAQDDAVLYGMEKAAQLLGIEFNTEVITTNHKNEIHDWNEWKRGV